MVAKERRRPVSDPSPRRMITPKLPAVRNGTDLARWTPPGREGWSTPPLGY